LKYYHLVVAKKRKYLALQAKLLPSRLALLK
jgi:hypothetical protein